jgi:hypothetical protein
MSRRPRPDYLRRPPIPVPSAQSQILCARAQVRMEEIEDKAAADLRAYHEESQEMVKMLGPGLHHYGPLLQIGERVKAVKDYVVARRQLYKTFLIDAGYIMEALEINVNYPVDWCEYRE